MRVADRIEEKILRNQVAMMAALSELLTAAGTHEGFPVHAKMLKHRKITEDLLFQTFGNPHD